SDAPGKSREASSTERPLSLPETPMAFFQVSGDASSSEKPSACTTPSHCPTQRPNVKREAPESKTCPPAPARCFEPPKRTTGGGSSSTTDTGVSAPAC